MKRYPPPRTGPHTGWSPQRDRWAQELFRRALIKRSGGRCEFLIRSEIDGPIDVGGYRLPFKYERCNSTDRLQAHHDREGYEPECGRLLCWTHHKEADPYAR